MKQISRKNEEERNFNTSRRRYAGNHGGRNRTFYAVSIWNQYLIPQIYLKSDNYKVIQQVRKEVVIADAGASTAFKNVIVNGITLNQQNLKAAVIFIAILPIILVYPFVQKYFKKGIMIGAAKGCPERSIYGKLY